MYIHRILVCWQYIGKKRTKEKNGTSLCSHMVGSRKEELPVQAENRETAGLLRCMIVLIVFRNNGLFKDCYNSFLGLLTVIPCQQ